MVAVPFDLAPDRSHGAGGRHRFGLVAQFLVGDGLGHRDVALQEDSELVADVEVDRVEGLDV